MLNEGSVSGFVLLGSGRSLTSRGTGRFSGHWGYLIFFSLSLSPLSVLSFRLTNLPHHILAA